MIEAISSLALSKKWNVASISTDIVQKIGFEDGIELSAPHKDLKIEVYTGKDQLFCNIGSYGRFEYADLTGEQKRNKQEYLLKMLEDIFSNGILVEIHRRRGVTLRTKVYTAGLGDRRLLAKTIDRFGFFGGKKEVLHLGK